MKPPTNVPILPPMTKEETRLARKLGKEIQKIQKQSHGPIYGGFIYDRCHCRHSHA